jgi:hypothetical protein
MASCTCTVHALQAEAQQAAMQELQDQKLGKANGQLPPKALPDISESGSMGNGPAAAATAPIAT